METTIEYIGGYIEIIERNMETSCYERVLT